MHAWECSIKKVGANSCVNLSIFVSFVIPLIEQAP